MDYHEESDSEEVEKELEKRDLGPAKKQKSTNRDYICKQMSSLILSGYAMDRIKKSDVEMHWPPLISKLIYDVDEKYEKKTLLTESTLVMLELCLNVKIQSEICISGNYFNVNEMVIPFRDKLFVNAITIIDDFLKLGYLLNTDVKPEVLEIIKEIEERK